MAGEGDRLGEYVLQEVVGSGGFGTVWRARHVHLQRDVAIKIPHDVAYARHLEKEGVIQHGLRHPRIVRTLGLVLGADPPHVVLEYLDGGSLRSRIPKHGNFELSMALWVFFPILEAMAYAHERGVAHLDLKPENVLFGSGRQVKVTDFGLGTAQKELTSLILSRSLQTLGEVAFAGTLEYMAPEQRRGEEGGPAADVYAMGVILYELCTGRRPAGWFPLPSEVNSTLPASLDPVVERALDSRAERRHATASKLRDALLEALPPDAYRKVAVVRREVTGEPVCPQGHGALHAVPVPVPPSGERSREPGALVGEYVLERPLAARHGGIEVWRGRHIHLPEKIAAIKLATGPGAADVLQEEALFHEKATRTGAMAELYGVDLDRDPPYLIREFLDGGSLADLRAEHGPLPAGVVAAIALELGGALEGLHAEGLAHGRLKPENVFFLRRGGRLILADPGLAGDPDPSADVAAAATLLCALATGGDLSGLLAEAARRPPSAAELRERVARLALSLKAPPDTASMPAHLPFASFARERRTAFRDAARCRECRGIYIDRLTLLAWPAPEAGGEPFAFARAVTLATPCPVCGDTLRGSRYGSVAEVDLAWCPADGVWLEPLACQNLAGRALACAPQGIPGIWARTLPGLVAALEQKE